MITFSPRQQRAPSQGEASRHANVMGWLATAVVVSELPRFASAEACVVTLCLCISELLFMISRGVSLVMVAPRQPAGWMAVVGLRLITSYCPACAHPSGRCERRDSQPAGLVVSVWWDSLYYIYTIYMYILYTYIYQ